MLAYEELSVAPGALAKDVARGKFNLALIHDRDGDKRRAIEIWQDIVADAEATGQTTAGGASRRRSVCHLAPIHHRDGDNRRAIEVSQNVIVTALDYIGMRIGEVLDGSDRSGIAAKIAEPDRNAIRQILADTKPAVARALSAPSAAQPAAAR